MNNSENTALCGKIIKSTGGLFTVETTDGEDKGKIYECRERRPGWILIKQSTLQ
jgi:hypothetical protein